MHDWIETCNFNMFGAVFVTISILSAPNSIPSHVIFVYLVLTLLRTCSCCFHVTSSWREWDLLLHYFLRIYTANLPKIFIFFNCSVGGDDEILSNEVKSLGVKFLYLISNTHQVFLVLGKHTSLTAALLIERFLLIIQQGGISFYNFYNLIFCLKKYLNRSLHKV